MGPKQRSGRETEQSGGSSTCEHQPPPLHCLWPCRCQREAWRLMVACWKEVRAPCCLQGRGGAHQPPEPPPLMACMLRPASGFDAMHA